MEFQSEGKGDEAKREHSTSKFNKTQKAHNSNTQIAHKRFIPTTRHTATLTQFYFYPTGAFPRAFTQNPNEKKEKGSCDFPFRVVPRRPARSHRMVAKWARAPSRPPSIGTAG